MGSLLPGWDTTKVLEGHSKDAEALDDDEAKGYFAKLEKRKSLKTRSMEIGSVSQPVSPPAREPLKISNILRPLSKTSLKARHTVGVTKWEEELDCLHTRPKVQHTESVRGTADVEPEHIAAWWAQMPSGTLNLPMDMVEERHERHGTSAHETFMVPAGMPGLSLCGLNSPKDKGETSKPRMEGAR